MNFKATLTAVALASTAAFAAQAGTVLSDNFNSGTPGTPWAGDSVFSSPSSYAPYGGGSGASTDLVANGSFGITCFGGAGNCVDLDGTGPAGNNPAGVLQSIASFAAGTYTLTFDMSGNQRGAAGQTTDIYLGSQLVDTIGPLASNSPWTLYTATFTGSGNLTFVEVGPSDNQGNLLDNVTLSTNVPEPATWALMLLGFGALGALLRRRAKPTFA